MTISLPNCYRCSQVYHDGKCGCEDGITLICADCRDVLPLLEPGSVDVVITDPPYFLPAHHHATRQGASKSWGNLSILEHFFTGVFGECCTAMRPKGRLYCFCDGQSYPVFFRAGYSHFKAMRPIVWDKLNSINGYWWRHQHELILFATLRDTPKEPTGDGDVIREKCVPVQERTHDAEKPVSLFRILVAKGCSDVVLDPFAGSGTTGRACKDLGRKCIQIEIEEKYCEIAANRLKQGVLFT